MSIFLVTKNENTYFTTLLHSTLGNIFTGVIKKCPQFVPENFAQKR